ncbi:MAG: PAS domain-containing protein, partial [Nitrospinae bacterium]|nr:PAS domain-containing protein [Nitrospinota bacterium]
MFYKQWLDEIVNLRKEINKWEPSQEHDKAARRMFFEFSEKMERYIEKHMLESETRQLQEMQIEMALCFTGDAVCISNPDGEIRLINPALETLAGIPGTSIIGNSLEKIWKKAPQDELIALRELLTRGRDRRDIYTLTTGDNQEIIVEISGTPIISPTGKITNHLYMLRNITEEEALKKGLIEQKDFLEKVINLTSNLIIILGPKGEWKMDNLAAKTLITDMGKGSREGFAAQLFAEVYRKKPQSEIKVDLNGKG